MRGDRNVPDASPIVGEKHPDEQEAVGRRRDHERCRHVRCPGVRVHADRPGSGSEPRLDTLWFVCASVKSGLYDHHGVLVIRLAGCMTFNWL